jgi:uroporphyrinogen-III decarboxylase
MISGVDQVLAVLTGEPVEPRLCFSGLINVTRPGLDGIGLTLAEVHHNAEKMAAAAASTHRMFGLGSAVVPLDMCIEAELLGASMVFAPGGEESELPWIVETRTDPDSVAKLLDSLTDLLIEVASSYREAGADFPQRSRDGDSPGSSDHLPSRN